MSLLLFSLCNKENQNNNKPEPAATFDKQGMLINYADNLILPSYKGFKSSLDSLVLVYNQFKTNPTVTTLQNVKQQFYFSYLNYQKIDLFEFGPAESIGIRNNFNVFPCDTSKINNNIKSGTYDLKLISNLACKGFPALDYLLFGYNQSEDQILKSFTQSSSRFKYIDDLLGEMSLKTNAVIDGWNASYRTTFINSLATDVGSSIGFMVNQINFQLDYLKNAKIGIPLGKKSLGTFLPEKSEAFYSSIYAKTFVIETFNLIENCYSGKGKTGTNGLGFDDYLIHLNAKHNNNLLNDDILAQMMIVKSKLNSIQSPLSIQFTNNSATVDAAYSELVKLLVLLKTDMPSALGVIITYQDGDGD